MNKKIVPTTVLGLLTFAAFYTLTNAIDQERDSERVVTVERTQELRNS